jgi:lipopolysaccharide/colanic/teichoic acid biosynthesis glycosyltransferase
LSTEERSTSYVDRVSLRAPAFRHHVVLTRQAAPLWALDWSWVPRRSLAYLATKRLLDLVIATVGLLIAALPLAVIAVAIKLESPGPVLYTHPRVGAGGREFGCYKLRSMAVSHDVETHRRYMRYLIANGATVAATHLPEREITRVGRLIRHLSIDELPQLVNVLKGDMSIVGPRPPLPYEVAEYSSEHLKRLAIAPGLTGYWQIKGRGRVTFDEMCRLDIEYITKRSLALDLAIIARTPFAMLRGAG